jgi:D-serine deaminase-like pyridoxal phosphate-dependent protein
MTPGEITELDQLPTPALVVDLDIFDANVAAARKLMAGSGKTLRPHVKTHKTPELAKRQLGEGVKGVTCATVGEAEAMVEAGIDDVLLANEIVSLDKTERIARLAARAKVMVAVDSDLGIDRLEAAAAREQSNVDVLVDVDVGLNRCGVRDMTDLLRLTKCVLKASHLRFQGLMGYEGRLRAGAENRNGKLDQARHSLEEAKTILNKAGIEVKIVSGGGTSTLLDVLAFPVLTEIQAGTYALMEPVLDGLGLPFDVASFVIATVISRSAEVAVLDAGRKSITIDSGPPGIPFEGTVVAVNEEHTVLHTSTHLEVGMHVKLTPSKVPTTFNLHDRVWISQADGLRSVPVTARGHAD